MNYKKIKIYYKMVDFDRLVGMLYDNDIVNLIIEDDVTEPFVEFCLEEVEFGKLDVIKGEKDFVVREVDISNREMEGLYREYYETIHITDRIVIVPEWEVYEAREDEIVVTLKSGMAWGNGQHETTALCAELLEKYIRPGDRVIDVGTGTGVLAVIASKLGASCVKAVDIDKYSVDVTEENLKLCDVSNVSVELGELGAIKDFKANVVVANIVAECIVEITEGIEEYLEDGGIFISSGISNRKLKSVVENLYKMEILEIKNKNDWNAIVARKK